MHALIFAAGLGTRMRPHTDHLPKPLFPVLGVPLLDRLVLQLAKAGATKIFVNTHHLGEQIRAHIEASDWPVPVEIRHEPVLLDTGGTIRKLVGETGTTPLLAVNGDVYTDFDFKTLVHAHEKTDATATLVLTDAPDIANVHVAAGHITGFREKPGAGDTRRAFTGIQLLSETALSRFADHAPPFSSIPVYQKMIEDGFPVHALEMEAGTVWSDMGTPERFRDRVLGLMAENELDATASRLAFSRLAGDGSDRGWFRIHTKDRSVIAADHGIHTGEETSEACSMVRLGALLEASGIPVPKRLAHDRFSGLVLLEDLGDERLHDRILEHGPGAVTGIYKKLLALLPNFVAAGNGFTPDMAWRDAAYNEALVLERECDYFQTAFLGGVLGIKRDPGLAPGFRHLAARIQETGIPGLLHRDLQSRNVMLKGETPVLIDFQGGMRGPVQYDAAALIDDPYAALPSGMRNGLYRFAADVMEQAGFDGSEFQAGLRYCRISRLLQALGAYGFLWKMKNKPFFKEHIPVALTHLEEAVREAGDPEFAPLAGRLASVSPLSCP